MVLKFYVDFCLIRPIDLVAHTLHKCSAAEAAKIGPVRKLL